MYTEDLPIHHSLLKEISPLQVQIIKALLYFDIFDHPLREEEIEELIPMRSPSTEAILEALHVLLELKYIHTSNGFYFIGEERGKVARREKGNSLAIQKMKTARKYAHLISRFPFVRAICISGSLSKGYMDKDSDIDYFVVTEADRLWFARMLLTIFKKVFLFNSRKHFCINYFIDDRSLIIPDKNLFTATELAHIIPVFNYGLYEDIVMANRWLEDYYPNFPLREENGVIPYELSAVRQFIEKTFDNRVGDMLDKWAHTLFRTYIIKKYKPSPNPENELNLRARKNVSKHHPQGFQGKVLDKYAEKIKGYELEYNLLLNEIHPLHKSIISE